MRVTISARALAPHGRGTGARLRRCAFLATALVLGPGCFTNPINRAPEVRSIERVGTFARGEDAEFTAFATDPDGDPVELSWGAAAASEGCPSPNDSSKWPARMSTSTYTVPGGLTSDKFCVWAFATDKYGAIGVNNGTFIAEDRPPVAAIVQTSPKQTSMYYLRTKFELDGSQSHDPDDDEITDYRWTLLLPSGKTTVIDPCDAGAPRGPHCFQAAEPGRYVVSLTVTANKVEGTTSTPPIDVHADTPPCIAEWTHEITPVPLDASAEQQFAVTQVFDDGVLNPQYVTYTWFMTPPEAPAGAAPVAQDVSFSRFTIPKDKFKLGDTTTVRVEVNDDRGSVVEDILRRCGDAPLCSTIDPITNGECFQRISWSVTWDL